MLSPPPPLIIMLYYCDNAGCVTGLVKGCGYCNVLTPTFCEV